MTERSKNLELAAKGFAFSLFLSFLILFAYLMVGKSAEMLTGKALETGSAGTTVTLLSLMLIVISALFYMAAFWLSIAEILGSKKEVPWKLGWVLFCVSIVIVGFSAYYLFGRKALE